MCRPILTTFKVVKYLTYVHYSFYLLESETKTNNSKVKLAQILDIHGSNLQRAIFDFTFLLLREKD
jgi:hypothetical protein